MPTALVIHHTGLVGGGTTSFLDVLHALSQRFKVMAACPSSPEHAATLVRREGFEVVPFIVEPPEFHAYNGGPDFASRQFWRGITRSVANTKQWASFMRDTGADVIVANSSVLVALGPAIERAGMKSICIVRETVPSRTTRGKIVLRALARWFDGVVFISELDRLRAGPLGTRTIVARDCVRAGAFRRLNRADACKDLGLYPQAFNVLYTGGHSWLKGLDLAMAAVETASLPDARLIVSGAKGPTRHSTKDHLRLLLHRRSAVFDARVESLMARNWLRSRVNYVGMQLDMSACYSAADVVLFPARLEHQSRPLLEAAHYGLPVLCTDFPQYAETAPERISFPVSDIQEMASAIVVVHDNYPEVQRRAQVNRRRSTLLNDLDTEGALLTEFALSLL